MPKASTTFAFAPDGSILLAEQADLGGSDFLESCLLDKFECWLVFSAQIQLNN